MPQLLTVVGGDAVACVVAPWSFLAKSSGDLQLWLKSQGRKTLDKAPQFVLNVGELYDTIYLFS